MQSLYWLNDKSMRYWEICQGNQVVKVIEKMAEDANREKVEKMVYQMNMGLTKRKYKKKLVDIKD